MRLLKILFLCSSFLVLCSCVVKPMFTEAYDKKCHVIKKKIELSVEQLQGFEQLNCSGSHDCEAQFLGSIVGAAILFPLSAVISGSIAVVGNTIYWVIDQNKCNEVT